VSSFSRRTLGIVLGLPAPVAASFALLGSLLLLLASGMTGAVPHIPEAAAAVPGQSTGPSELTERLPSADERALDREASALLERWAPSFALDVSSDHPERDRPVSIDFDDDWDATNNWDHLAPDLTARPPVVHGSAILTATHAYLTFTLFYPRDWFWPACVPYVCHDNDLEVVLLVVERAMGPARAEPGTLVFVETKAHNDYIARRGSELALDAAGHPWISVESQGHGMHPLLASERLPSGDQTIVLRGRTGSEQEPPGADGSYELVSLRETLWARREISAAHGALWSSGETGFLAYAGARQGRRGFLLGASMAGRRYAGGVRPPWGLKASVGERGDWFLDPAYVALSRHRDWFGPSAPSLDYVFNPYLADLGRECLDLACPFIRQPPLLGLAQVGAAGWTLLGLGLVSLGARGRARAGWPRFGRRTRAP